MTEQSCLLEDAQKAGMEITKEILSLYPAEGNATLATPQDDVMTLTFAAAQKHTEEALVALHDCRHLCINTFRCLKSGSSLLEHSR